MELSTIIIPKQVENLQLPDPELLSYYKDLEDRVLWLNTEVDDECLDLGKKIIAWNKEDIGQSPEYRAPIRIFFFSPGGSLDVNNSLIDIISLSETPVYGYNMGRCYSAAAYIFLSCHKRYTLSNSQFLLHQGSGTFEGAYQEILPQMMAYQAQIENLNNFVAKRTNYTPDEVAENIISDWYIDTKEGLEKGVYHGIISSMSELL